MQKSLLALGLAAIVATGLLLAGWWLRRVPERKPTAAEIPPSPSARKDAGRLDPARPAAPLEAVQQLQRTLMELLDKVSPGQRTAMLPGLQRSLEETPNAERLNMLEEFFASGRDSELGGQFKVGPEGGLTASPTLRVWLLNELTRLNPSAAAKLGRQVLRSMDSPDEWAVALRAVALGDQTPDGRALIKERTLRLLHHGNWQSQPTSGYLNAFDVAVHLKDSEFAPVLSGLLRQTNQPALAHAAFLALDRLTLAAPVEFLQALQTQAAGLDGREAARAGFFARADASIPEQRVVLEQYLLDRHRSTEELDAFAATYPNASLFLSHNLLTRQVVFDGTTLARRDAAALAIVRQWLTEPRFANRREHLSIVEMRLVEFTRQASNQGRP